ncbi:MAG: hypothetical protein ACYS8W_02910 [Planctomycetota bacterium]
MSRFRAALFFLSLFTLIAITGSTNAAYLSNPVDCYALIIVAADDTNTTIKKNLDPIDINGAEVSLSRVYGALIKAKYKDDNIKVLYWNGQLQPNWAEKKNAKYFRRLKKYHFKGSYAATYSNIQSVIDSLKQKLDDNDQFVFYILTHGMANGTIQLANRQSLTTSQMQTLFTGFKSKTNFLLFDSCYSGKIIDNIDIPNAVIVTATTNRTPGWVDRDFSNCAYFLESKLKKTNDKDKDGVVDAEEAFDAATKYAKKYDKGWRKYMKTKYRPPRPLPPRILEMTSIIPTMEIGEDFEPNCLGPGTASSRKRRTKSKKDPGEKYIKQADSYVKSKKYVKAIETYRKVEKMGKRTKLAEEATKKIKELLEDEKIATIYAAAEREKKLDSDLAMAESYLLAGNQEKVVEYCNKVIEAAPDSEQAKKAKELLELVKK